MVSEKIEEATQPKREAILQAARVLFATKGYEETTIADIAKEAGIAVGTVYLYFRNKREVYTNVALDIESLLTDAFRDPELLQLPFRQLPKALVDTVFEVSRKYQDLMFLLQIDLQSSEESAKHKHSHQKITDALAAIFQNAIDRGELAPFNAEMYALLLTFMGSDLLHQCFAIEMGEREEIYRIYLTELIERLFFGPSLQEGYPQNNI